MLLALSFRLVWPKIKLRKLAQERWHIHSNHTVFHAYNSGLFFPVFFRLCVVVKSLVTEKSTFILKKKEVWIKIFPAILTNVEFSKFFQQCSLDYVTKQLMIHLKLQYIVRTFGMILKITISLSYQNRDVVWDAGNCLQTGCIVNENEDNIRIQRKKTRA